MGEVKQFNFRVDQETADRFRQFCADNGLSQAQGFDHVMQVMELDRAKAAVPERQTEMEEYESAIKKILALYMTSIEMSSNAEARAKEQFAGMLDTKDKTIIQLQRQLEIAEAAQATAEKAQENAEKEARSAADKAAVALGERDTARSAYADKERLNAILSEKLANQEDKLKKYDSVVKDVEKYKAQNLELADQLKEARYSIQSKTETLENMEKQTDLAIKLAVQEATMEKEREMHDRILALEKENTKLQVQLEHLSYQSEENKA